MDPLALLPNPWLLAAGVLLDLLFGDPEYRAHPVRLIGKVLEWNEKWLRRIGIDGYFGGIQLFLRLSLVWAV